MPMNLIIMGILSPSVIVSMEIVSPKVQVPKQLAIMEPWHNNGQVNFNQLTVTIASMMRTRIFKITIKICKAGHLK